MYNKLQFSNTYCYMTILQNIATKYAFHATSLHCHSLIILLFLCYTISLLRTSLIIYQCFVYALTSHNQVCLAQVAFYNTTAARNM